jgi:hypothetical protein
MAEAFERLGLHSVVQDVQIKHTRKYFDIAERDLNRFGVENELGLALCFDIAVQNGGINSNEGERKKENSTKSPNNTTRIANYYCKCSSRK